MNAGRGRPGSFVVVAVLALGSIGLIRATSPSTPLVLSLLPEGVSAHRIDGEQVFLRRSGSDVIGFLANAHHVGDRVVWCPSEEVFLSPAHGELFDAQGSYVDGPAGRDLDRVPVERLGNALSVRLNEVIVSAGRSFGVVSETIARTHQAWMRGDDPAGARFCRNPIG